MLRTTNNHDQSGMRRVAILTLSVILLLAVVAVSYAWFRNVIDVNGANMTTGQMKYRFAGFYKDAGDNLQSDFKYSTENEEGFTKIGKEENLTAESHVTTTVTTATHGEIYYVVQRLEGSIPLDVALQIEATIADLEEIGGFWYYIEDKVGSTTKFSSSSATVESIVGECYSTPFDPSNSNLLEMLKLSQDVRQKSITGDNDYLCIRLSYGIKDTATSPDYTGKTITFNPKISVAQVGGLQGSEGTTQRYTVTSLATLEAALKAYVPGAEIVVQSDLTYNGDLIFNRPVNLTLQGATLTVKGDVRFTYTGAEGSFTLNTAQNGALAVQKASETSGGNFYAELPNSGLNLIGKSKADITVSGLFAVEVSKNSGMLINRAELLNEGGKLAAVTVRGNSLIYVGRYTEVAEIKADSSYEHPLYAIKILNYGTIQSINLIGTTLTQNKYTLPLIYIDNYARITKPIELPSWSEKYTPAIDTEPESGNTRVCQNLGAFDIRVAESNSAFKNEHIEHLGKDILVEKVNGDDTKIIVHYAKQPGDTTTPTLENLLNEYSNKTNEYKIAGISDLTSVTVITYGEIVMTEDDYETVRRMSSLETLDLSDAVSQGQKLPDEAFKGLTKLKNVTMSESDTIWGEDILFGTAVDEIRIPLNAMNMTEASFRLSGMADATATYIKYIHVQRSDVTLALPTASYVFVPDEIAVARYTPGKTFVEATRFATDYGDYFLRSLGSTYAFVVYTGNSSDWYKVFDGTLESIDLGDEQKNYSRLDLASIQLNGGDYPLSEIGNYAFANRFRLEDTDKKLRFYITLGENITKLGDKAFSGCTALVGMEGSGVSYLGASAIDSCTELVKLAFPSLTSVTAEKKEAITGCTKLKYIETGVVNQKLNDSQCPSITDRSTWRAIDIHVVRSIGSEDTATISVVPLTAQTDNVNGIYAIIPGNVKALYGSFQETGGGSGWGKYYSYTLNGNDFTFYPAYGNDIYTLPKFVAEPIDDTTVRIVVACIADPIDAADVFTGFPDNATTLGKLSFEMVEITCTNNSSLIFPESVKTVGYGAFFAGNGFGRSKNFHTLDLKNTVSAAQWAFYKCSFLFLKGEKIESLGSMAFQFCTLYSAELPALQSFDSDPFSGTDNLQYISVGALNLTSQNKRLSSAKNIKFAFIDAASRTNSGILLIQHLFPEDYLPQTIVSKNDFLGGPVDWLANKRFEIDSFSDLVFADYEAISCSAGSATGTLYLPTHLMTENSVSTVTYNRYLGAQITENNYTTVTHLYPVMEGDGKKQISFIGNRTMYTTEKPSETATADYTVTTIGANAFGAVSLDGKTFTVGDTVTALADNAFKGKKFDTFYLNKVKTVGANAFEGCTCRHFDFGETEEIGKYAFSNMTFGNVEMPNVKKVASYGFHKTTFGDVSMPEVETIAANGFKETIFDNIRMPKLKTVGDDAFRDATPGSFYMPELTTVGQYSFSFMKAKVDTLICDKLSTIGDHGFTNSAFSYVEFPALMEVKGHSLKGIETDTLVLSGATKICEEAFRNQKGIVNLIANKVITIEKNAFNSAQMNSISINAAQTVGYYAFYETSITCGSIYLPSIVTVESQAFTKAHVDNVTLGVYLEDMKEGFLGSSYLKKLSILADKIPNGASDAFPDITAEDMYRIVVCVKRTAEYNADTIKNIINYEYFDEVCSTENVDYYFTIVDKVAKTATLSSVNFKNAWQPADNFVFPYSVTNSDPKSETYEQTFTVIGIDNTVIKQITDVYKVSTVPLKTLTLPHTLQLIDFENTALPETLTAFAFTESTEGETVYFKAEDGVLYTADGSILVMYPQGKIGDSFTVPAEVTMIYKNAFYGSRLKEITVLGNVTVLEGAFASCINLTSVTFSGSDVSAFVGANVFANSYNVKNVYVPATLLDKYKNAAIFSTSVREKFTAIPEGGSTGEPTTPEGEANTEGEAA